MPEEPISYMATMQRALAGVEADIRDIEGRIRRNEPLRVTADDERLEFLQKERKAILDGIRRTEAALGSNIH